MVSVVGGQPTAQWFGVVFGLSIEPVREKKTNKISRYYYLPICATTAPLPPLSTTSPMPSAVCKEVYQVVFTGVKHSIR